MTKQVNVASLSGVALDWAVAKCGGRTLKRYPMGAEPGHGWWVWEETPSGMGGILLSKSVYLAVGPYTVPKTRNSPARYTPSTDWAQGGPIVEREGICIKRQLPCSVGYEWNSWQHTKFGNGDASGPTPLTAAMRCLVVGKLGEEIEIPYELSCKLT